MKLMLALFLMATVLVNDLPQFPYGAVYFRKTNPPGEDWERDYAQAARDGMNAFRHWFMWGSIEIAPGKYDWADYDRQLDLAAQHGMGTIIGEIVHSAPEWAFRRYAHARYEAADGRKSGSNMRNSSVTGGYPGLCLDNEDYKAHAETFLTALVTRYRRHPGLAGYDIWNEANAHSSAFEACYCPATVKKFHEWLKNKYGGLAGVAKAWRRYSFETWDDVTPPRETFPYPENLDWARFRIENLYRLMKWRVDLFRRLDPKHPITAHGVADRTLSDHAELAHDAWRAGALVDIYGYSRGSAYEDRLENNWRRWTNADLARAGAHGKPFWAAEMSGGPGWGARSGARDQGRLPRAHDVRVANFIGMGGGARGIFSARWRPLLDGPLFGSLGFYAMDGSPTERSEMAGRIAKWANAPERRELWQARPVQGDIGIIFVPDSQIFTTLANAGASTFYAESAEGAYRGFLDNNIQADWVHVDQIDRYDLLYLPYPVMLPAPVAAALTAWVERGGTLISEGCPGYFGDDGRAGTRQPNFGLDRVFGAREHEVEFTPDLLENLQFRVGDLAGVAGGINLQTFKAAGGTAAGWYADNRVALVDHKFGKGRTRLIGTHPGYGYAKHRSEATRRFFAGLLEWAGKEQHVRRTGELVARLHNGAGGTYLWIVNNTMKAASMELSLSRQWGLFRTTEVVWGDSRPELNERQLRVSVPAVDALVLRLRR